MEKNGKSKDIKLSTRLTGGTEILSKYKEFYNLQSEGEKYYIKIGITRSNKIIIKCYNLEILNNLCYQITLDINDIFNISKKFIPYDNISNIFNVLIELISNEQFSFKSSPNDNLILSILLQDSSEIKNQTNTEANFILYKTNISNITEYSNILCYVINELKINFFHVREEYSEKYSEYINTNNTLVKDIKFLYEENNKLKGMFQELSDQNKKNKMEINSLKNIIHKLKNNESLVKENQVERKSKMSLNDFNKRFHTNIKDSKIKELYLSFNNIDDNLLKFLEKAEFTQLQELSLSSNKISDIKVLEKVNFLDLRKLSLSNNKIKDISVLANVKFNKLLELYLDNNNISDINVFEKVKFNKLALLYLDNNKIRDITVFKKTQFYELQELSLSSNKISNINEIRSYNLDKLDLLYLDNNNIDVNLVSNIMIIEFLESTINRFKI